MASLLKMALEGELGNPQDVTSGKPTAAEGGEKELVELKGPLSLQFAEALAQLYNKRKSDHEEDTQEEASSTALESQANDALMLQELADNIRILNQDEESDNSTTIYGVDATDVKPEDVVEVSQDLAQFGEEETPDYVVVMNADLPSVDGQGGVANAVPEVNQFGKALEAMCERRGVKVYYSLEQLSEHFKKD
jgi:hypothetical protein